MSRRDPEFTPPVIYSLENRQKLVYLVEARPEGDAGPLQPGQIVDVDLADAGKMNAIDVHGLVKRFGDKTVVDHVTMAVARGRDRRLPRAERLGQDHDHPHHVRPADAR